MHILDRIDTTRLASKHECHMALPDFFFVSLLSSVSDIRILLLSCSLSVVVVPIFQLCIGETKLILVRGSGFFHDDFFFFLHSFHFESHNEILLFPSPLDTINVAVCSQAHDSLFICSYFYFVCLCAVRRIH